MKIEIVVVYIQRYRRGHEVHFEGRTHYEPIREIVEPLMHIPQDAEPGALQQTAAPSTVSLDSSRRG
jgi:hypothetical protein